MYIFPDNEFFQVTIKGYSSPFLVEVDTRRWVIAMFHGAIPPISKSQIIKACQGRTFDIIKAKRVTK